MHGRKPAGDPPRLTVAAVRPHPALVCGRVVVCLIVWTLACPAGAVLAADTLEQYDPGFSDFDLYLMYTGAGRAEPDRGWAALTLVGIGITDWLSGELMLEGEANERLSEASGAFSFGAFATPVDTDHFDLDIGFHVIVGGLGAGKPDPPAGHDQADFFFAPFLEINLDTDPDMNGFGAWLWLESDIGGRDDSTLDARGNEIRDFTVTAETLLLVGAYYRFLERHQVVLAYDMAFDHNAPAGERTFLNGGPSLGYNLMVVPDRLELITEVRFDIPQGGEGLGTDLLVGFIATFPPKD